MAELIIRPSFKKVWLAYAVCGLLFLAFCAFYGWYQPAGWPAWLITVPLVLFIWPIAMHVGRSFTILTVEEGKLRYQTGILSRSTRTMDLSRLQDVRVEQTLWERMIRIGSISVETAGESGGLTMESVDGPQRRADAILEAARGRTANAGI